MKMRSPVLALALLLLAGPLAHAQQSQRGGRDNRSRGGGMDGPTYNIMPEGMPGLWWRITPLAQKIGLTAEQQKHMDDIFNESLPQLVQQSRELRKERTALQALLDANPPDIARILPQLDRIAQGRAALEVARDKVLLNIRTVLTPDQWNKLQAENRRWLAEHPNGGRDEHRDHNFQGRPGNSSPAQSGQPAP